MISTPTGPANFWMEMPLPPNRDPVETTDSRHGSDVCWISRAHNPVLYLPMLDGEEIYQTREVNLRPRRSTLSDTVYASVDHIMVPVDDCHEVTEAFPSLSLRQSPSAARLPLTPTR